MNLELYLVQLHRNWEERRRAVQSYMLGPDSPPPPRARGVYVPRALLKPENLEPGRLAPKSGPYNR